MRKQTSQTGCHPWNHVHRHAVATHRGGINPRASRLQCKIIKQVAGFEVVGAIENQLCPAQQGLNVRRNQVLDLWFNYNLGVEGGDFARGRDGFGQRLRRVRLVK